MTINDYQICLAFLTCLMAVGDDCQWHDANRSAPCDAQIILHGLHTRIQRLPASILWWPDQPTSITYQYTMLTSQHPMMTRSSYTDDMPVYSAYQPWSFDVQIILHRFHAGIQYLPISNPWWPDHPTPITYRYTGLTSYNILITRLSYMDYILVYNPYQATFFDDKIILHRLPVGIQGLPVTILW